jgi:hypothetical protein
VQATRTREIYANLRAVGINVELLREYCLGFDELKGFHDRILRLLDNYKTNTQSVAA